MKRVVVMLCVFLLPCITHATEKYKLLIPSSGYPKSAYDGYPVLIFPSQEMNWVMTDVRYDPFEQDVKNSFKAWENKTGRNYFNDNEAMTGISLRQLSLPLGDGGKAEVVYDNTTYVINPNSSKIYLRAEATWLDNGTQDVSSGYIDVQSILTHEIGHVLGVGDFPVGGVDGYTDNTSAPSMCGGASSTLRTSVEGRTLETDDQKAVECIHLSYRHSIIRLPVRSRRQIRMVLVMSLSSRERMPFRRISLQEAIHF